MQPLIQNRKTEDTDLKRVFHPDCLKDPFPSGNFGLATWLAAFRARNLFPSLTPAIKGHETCVAFHMSSFLLFCS